MRKPLLVKALFLLASAASFTSCYDKLADDCGNLGKCADPSGTGGISGVGGLNHGGLGGSAQQAGSGFSGAPAGGAGSDVCGGVCKANTPICNENTRQCVECTDDTQCTGTTPACDRSTNTCVACTETRHCSNDKLCDTTKRECVQCIGPTDCKSASAAFCEAGECKPCRTGTTDCSHITGSTVCAEGACVQCTASDESACAGNSCDPSTQHCTNTPLGSVGTCQPCVADSECLGWSKSDPERRCVPMQFKGTPRGGGFCLKREAKGCDRPFTVPVAGRSLSGADNETYCGLAQDVTRCEAILDLGVAQTCADGKDESCGCVRDQDGKCTEVGSGGLCRKVGTLQNQCTYGCGHPSQCPSGITCSLDAPYCH